MANTVLETVNVATNTFKNWLDKTNDAITVLKQQAVTVDITAGGDTVTGNGFANGILGANTLVATTIRGGNVTSTTNLAISSNLTISANYSNVVANLTIYSNSTILAAAFLGNSTVTNSTFKSTHFNIQSNSVINGSTHLIIGNTTVGNTTGGNAAIFVDNTNKRLGVANAAPTVTLVVGGPSIFQGNVSIANSTANTLGIIYGTATSNSGAIFNIDTFPTTRYRSGEYHLHINDLDNPTSFQASKIMIMHDDTSAFMTEYAVLQNNGLLGAFSSDINGGNIRLRFTPVISNTSVKYMGTLVTV